MTLVVFTTSCTSGSESVSSVSEDRKASTSPEQAIRDDRYDDDDDDDNDNDDDKYDNMMIMMTNMMIMMKMKMASKTCTISRVLVCFCLLF